MPSQGLGYVGLGSFGLHIYLSEQHVFGLIGLWGCLGPNMQVLTMTSRICSAHRRSCSRPLCGDVPEVPRHLSCTFPFGPSRNDCYHLLVLGLLLFDCSSRRRADCRWLCLTIRAFCALGILAAIGLGMVHIDHISFMDGIALGISE